MSVHLLELLCENRHIIMGCAYDDADKTQAEAQSAMGEMVKKLRLNPFCGVCGMTQGKFTYEDTETPFKSLQDAAPFLRERQQRELAAMRAAAASTRSN